jgi:hypothetical protein
VEPIIKKCLLCGKEFIIKYSREKNKKYCSVFCSNKHTKNKQEVKEKIKQTNLKKYGTSSSMQNKSIMKKREENNIEKINKKKKNKWTI